MAITSRATLWPGQSVLTSSGSPRARLPKGLGLFAVHYVGVDRQYMRETTSVPGMLGIQTYAAGAGKPWEYNWMIGHDRRIQEYAGVYMAAHASGNNGSSHGCLLLLGKDETPNDNMIAALLELRRHLVDEGELAADHEVRPHFKMPGASTQCPGDAILSRWHEIDVPLPAKPKPAPKPTPDIIPTPVEDDMELALIRLKGTGASWITNGWHKRMVPAGDFKAAQDVVALSGGDPKVKELDAPLFRQLGGFVEGANPKFKGRKRDRWGVPQ